MASLGDSLLASDIAIAGSPSPQSNSQMATSTHVAAATTPTPPTKLTKPTASYGQPIDKEDRPMQTVNQFLNNPRPTLENPAAANPAFHPTQASIAGSAPPMPAQVKADLWDNAVGVGPNPVRAFFASIRNRNSV